MPWINSALPKALSDFGKAAKGVFVEGGPAVANWGEKVVHTVLAPARWTLNGATYLASVPIRMGNTVLRAAPGPVLAAAGIGAGVAAYSALKSRETLPDQLDPAQFAELGDPSAMMAMQNVVSPPAGMSLYAQSPGYDGSRMQVDAGSLELQGRINQQIAMGAGRGGGA